MASNATRTCNVPSINSSNSTGSNHNQPASPPVLQSGTSSVTTFSSGRPASGRRFKSTRLIGEFEKPWLETKQRGRNWGSYIVWICTLAGAAIGAYLCYNAVISVPQKDYCLILDDDFRAIDPNVWNHEIQIGGFGTGAFDWTTDDPVNSYTDAEGLHIVPTLTLESTEITYEQLVNGYKVNLTADARYTQSKDTETCTVTKVACQAESNSTTGKIINPVRSARLNTKGKKTIKYGRVEVVARLPKGDWLWPAIWMMPEESVYGLWPRSGEIDIAESRGNDASEYPKGNNQITSTLHWGTTSPSDQYTKTTTTFVSKRNKYSEGLHTFALEWSEKYLFTSLDGRLRQVYFINFTKNKSIWDLGTFSGDDPWSQNSNLNSPFDQNFYLILNVAVGSTNGYFPDGLGSKPWADNSPTAMRDFWKSNTTWSHTWGSGNTRGMTVKSVKMWKEGKCS